MKLKRLQQTPALIAVAVLGLVCLARVLHLDFETYERITYDQRVRVAQHFHPVVATNLGFVFINEDTVRAVMNREVGFHFGLYWPRQVYGRLVQELAAHGVELVAFDVLLGELRDDLHAPVAMANGDYLDSDVYFAQTMRQSGRVLLASTADLPPPDLFATNALALGDISTEKDPGGVLRRARAFRVYRRWHPAFRQVEADPDYGIDLRRARVEPGQIVLPRSIGEVVRIPVDAENNFDLADFGMPPKKGAPPKAKAFTEERIWHMGVSLAARHLQLDLDSAEVDLPHGRITMRGTGGITRVFPVDEDGFFYIDWALPPEDARLTKEPMHSLLWQNFQRLQGTNVPPPVDWRDKLVIVGSSAQVGNELTDRGATPLASDTILVSKHWNVANSIIVNRFVRRASTAVELLILVVIGAATAVLTLQRRPLTASLSVIALGAAYWFAAFLIYIRFRYWIPLVLPTLGALLMQHVCLVAYRVLFEQKERQRVKSVFSKIVAPEVMNELLSAERLSLGGARREVTVLFADVRGFTEFTDTTQERVAEYVRTRQVPRETAEACFDDFARETLGTVNAYLACVIDAAVKEKGIFDKLIGDCVMFFWGAPIAHPHQALAAVRAAIAAQRAILQLNQQRAGENERREIENRARESAGLPPKPPLPTLALGTGINTGMVTAGLMGSDTQSMNYTVFGREVNLASRLEGISGRGRIFISETTHAHLVRDDATLAATCIEREPTTPKGFNKPVRIFEVPWLPPGETPPDFQTMTFTKPKVSDAKS
ncbi:MAG: adenylate/guanylate cyclase domain-containing protein [Pedosphaera sp.]|nr:adenylate/guanylate cyclase domain-containing protein [Pedosphaera sp.]